MTNLVRGSVLLSFLASLSTSGREDPVARIPYGTKDSVGISLPDSAYLLLIEYHPGTRPRVLFPAPEADPRPKSEDPASPVESCMFVIALTYKAPLAKLDAIMKEHVAFLKKYYSAGNFLLSGRQIPRVGGIIIAVGESREQIEAIMAEDPFCREGLADARVIEFRASQRAADIQQRLDSY